MIAVMPSVPSSTGIATGWGLTRGQQRYQLRVADRRHVNVFTGQWSVCAVPDPITRSNGARVTAELCSVSVDKHVVGKHS
jgi:hypothetical protein